MKRLVRVVERELIQQEHPFVAADLNVRNIIADVTVLIYRSHRFWKCDSYLR